MSLKPLAFAALLSGAAIVSLSCAALSADLPSRKGAPVAPPVASA